MKVTKNGG